MSSYKTQAIIINRLNLGESDKILTLFSPDYGKIRAVAKGSRRTKSKFGGHTELFSLVELIISTGKNLDIVSEANLLKNFLANSPDIDKVKSAYYFGEIISKLLPDGSANKEVYDLYLYCLNNINVTDIRLLQLVFIARILKNLGIYPELSNCVKCEQKPDKSDIRFSKSAGGILDADCALHFGDSESTNEDTVKLWRYVAESLLENTLKISANPETVISANKLAIEYIHCVTMIDYKSLRVLS